MSILAAAGVVVYGVIDDREEIAQAVKKIGDSKSYKFAADVELEAGGNASPIPGIEGFYRKDQGTFAKFAERFQVARKGEKMVYTNRDGSWKKFEPPPPPAAGGQAQRPRGGGRASLDPTAILTQFKTPHDLLSGVEKKLEKVTREEKTERYDDADCAVYTGPYTEDGIRSLLPAADLLKRWGDPQIQGTGKLFVNPEGKLVRCRTEANLSFGLGGAAIDVTCVMDIKLSRLDALQEEIPTDAKELLEKE